MTDDASNAKTAEMTDRDLGHPAAIGQDPDLLVVAETGMENAATVTETTSDHVAAPWTRRSHGDAMALVAAVGTTLLGVGHGMIVRLGTLRKTPTMAMEMEMEMATATATVLETNPGDEEVTIMGPGTRDLGAMAHLEANQSRIERRSASASSLPCRRLPPIWTRQGEKG